MTDTNDTPKSLNTPIRVKITGRFDLGYLVQDKHHAQGQLRAPEMTGETLEHHIKGQEHLLFGKEIDAFLLIKRKEGFTISQKSPVQRQQQAQLAQDRQQAVELSQTGQRVQVTLAQKTSWGFICQEIDGHLQGGLKLSADQLDSLDVGQSIELEIDNKNELNVVFKLPT